MEKYNFLSIKIRLSSYALTFFFLKLFIIFWACSSFSSKQRQTFVSSLTYRHRRLSKFSVMIQIKRRVKSFNFPEFAKFLHFLSSLAAASSMTSESQTLFRAWFIVFTIWKLKQKTIFGQCSERKWNGNNW